MSKLLLLAAAAGFAATATAQAPSCNGPAPAGVFTTSFVGGVYLGTTSATAGFNQIFDLASNADITISQCDLHFYDNGVPAPNPVLTGLTTTVEFYTCPTTAVGNYTIPANWTLRSTGTVTIQANGTPSPAVFAPFVLPSGSYGAAVRVLPVFEPVSATNVGAHPLYTNPTSTPIATTFSDQYLTLTARGFQGTSWTGTPALRVWNGRIYYQPGANAGYSTQFGAGCYSRPQSFYDYRTGPGGGNFTVHPLANTVVSMLNLGANYFVIPAGAAPTIALPASTPLTTVGSTFDDDITAPITLPWSFPYPGGSTTDIRVSTNGHVFLGTSTATFGPYNMSQFFTDVPRLACFWSDLDLTSQGTMHYDVDPSNQFVTVTWFNCAEWDPNTGPGLGGSTFQIVLHANGNVDYVYNNASFYYCPAVVGFARGNGTADPGSINIAASLPFQSGDGRVPPVLGMDARPVTGTTSNFVCSGIDGASTLFSLLVMSFGSSPGLPLSLYGMPGCFQYVALPGVSVFGTVVNNQMSVPLTLPNSPAYNGVNLFAQAAPLTPGLNAANILTSNGLCVHIGIQ
jgi:hypothetical protein